MTGRDDEAAEGVDGRVAGLEEQVGELASLVAELAGKGASPAGPAPSPSVWRQRAFNPLEVSDPARRLDAWERLYTFVELVNATFGAQRTEAGTAPLYVRSGWWDSPLAVMHLSALCEAWVEASFTDGEPLAGGHDMLWLLLERAVPTLELVCGRSEEATRWSQQHRPTWSLEPPSLLAQRERTRRADFQEFLAQDAPVPARTAFACRMEAELNPPQRLAGLASAEEDWVPADEEDL
ncbi:hypothetical protein [Actinomyces wuliandei]|uniref:hypothetical protein n=1 Tax=Actinomyces wuliandei TaxID=2057743 RepID=UPI00111A1E2B|nr:hypothetical protein [Actinomyces wuliandei]